VNGDCLSGENGACGRGGQDAIHRTDLGNLNALPPALLAAHALTVPERGVGRAGAERGLASGDDGGLAGRTTTQRVAAEVARDGVV